MSNFGRHIQPFVQVELVAADASENEGAYAAFRHLERAHVLGQASTRQHIRVHWRMLKWAVRQREAREIAGQVFRIVAAAAMTWLGLVPRGNIGGANVSAFRPMPIPADLVARLNEALSRRLLHFLAIAIFAGLALADGMSAAAAPDDVRTITIDDSRVTFRVRGSGRPVIVLISGLGDGMATFDDVSRELAQNATVISYDRAGYGGSAPGRRPRDAPAEERELSGLLAQSGFAGPFVLLGHSTGGLIAEYYAAKHPDQVSGLILDDSRAADFTRLCSATRGAGMCVPPWWLTWMMPEGARAEAASLGAAMAQVQGSMPLKNKPVLVLSGAHGGSKKSPFDAAWTQTQNNLAARYQGARHLTAPAGGHYVHVDQRDWFLASVRTFLIQLR